LSLTAGRVFLEWAFSSFPLQVANVALENHSTYKGGPNQWIIRVKVTPQLLKIHLSLLDKSSRISASGVLTNGLG